MPEPRILLAGLAFGESPRWHDGRLWLADWGAQEVLAVDVEGASEVIDHIRSFPFCIDFLPDGRLLVVSADDQKVFRREADGSLVTHADLAGLSDTKWNDIATDGRGNAYINNIGFEFGGEFAPGFVTLVGRNGAVRQVADGLSFPNGMVVTPDGGTLIVAESYANRLTAFDIEADGGLSNRRPWADLGDGAAPDGICLDAEGTVWYGDVPNKRCVRVREGGEVLQTIELDRGCFACALGGPAGRTLFMVVTEWRGAESMNDGARTGQVLAVEVGVPGAPSDRSR
jgi:sugar lactone lactonase YvrE